MEKSKKLLIALLSLVLAIVIGGVVYTYAAANYVAVPNTFFDDLKQQCLDTCNDAGVTASGELVYLISDITYSDSTTTYYPASGGLFNNTFTFKVSDAVSISIDVNVNALSVLPVDTTVGENTIKVLPIDDSDFTVTYTLKDSLNPMNIASYPTEGTSLVVSDNNKYSAFINALKTAMEERTPSRPQGMFPADLDGESGAPYAWRKADIEDYANEVMNIVHTTFTKYTIDEDYDVISFDNSGGMLSPSSEDRGGLGSGDNLYIYEADHAFVKGDTFSTWKYNPVTFSFSFNKSDGTITMSVGTSENVVFTPVFSRTDPYSFERVDYNVAALAAIEESFKGNWHTSYNEFLNYKSSILSQLIDYEVTNEEYGTPIREAFESIDSEDAFKNFNSKGITTEHKNNSDIKLVLKFDTKATEPTLIVTRSTDNAMGYATENSYDFTAFDVSATLIQSQKDFVKAIEKLHNTLDVKCPATFLDLSEAKPGPNGKGALEEAWVQLAGSKTGTHHVGDTDFYYDKVQAGLIGTLQFIVNAYWCDDYWDEWDEDFLNDATALLIEVNDAVDAYITANKDHYDKQCLNDNKIPIFTKDSEYPFMYDSNTGKFADKLTLTSVKLGDEDVDISTTSVSDFIKNLDSAKKESYTGNDVNLQSLSYRMSLAAFAVANAKLDSTDPSATCSTCDDSGFLGMVMSTHECTGYEVEEWTIVPKAHVTDSEFITAYESHAVNGVSTRIGYFSAEPKEDFADRAHVKAYGFYIDVLAEYFAYTTDFRKTCEEDKNGGGLTDKQREVLAVLRGIYEECGPNTNGMLEAIVNLHGGTDDTDDQWSLRELWESEGIDGDSQKSPTIYDDANFVKNLDKTSPLGDFYITNSLYGYANIDREAIWNETSGFQSAEDVDAAIIYQQGIEDTVGLKTQETVMEDLFDGNEYLQDTDDISVDFNTNIGEGYSQNGFIDSAKAVTMSDYIVEGMTYSSTYVPLRTNLYDAVVLNSYSDTFKEEFFYKYGFMRKALLWDKSSTSVVDFINANNKTTNPLEVITLRDLLEAPGDVSLYVDDDFYNAQEAIEQGNVILDARIMKDKKLAEYLDEYYYTAEFLVDWAAFIGKDDTAADILSMTNVSIGFSGLIKNVFAPESEEQTEGDLADKIANVQDIHDTLYSQYNFNMDLLNMEDAKEWVDKLTDALTWSESSELNEQVLKDEDNINYSTQTQAYLTEIEGYEFTGADATTERNYDNLDSIVLPSSLISDYLDGKSMYLDEREQEGSEDILVQQYETYDNYNPMLSLAYVSAIYRDSDSFSLSNEVAHDNPIFLASEDAIQLSYCTDWYANTLLNYCFVKNLKSASQVDYSYVTDMDCPLYVDVFGNIVTESGLVVIPAACNMTLHNASYKDSYIAVGLYTIYGNNYMVPMDLSYASKVMFPFFAVDIDDEVYVIDGKTVKLGEGSVKFNEISPYDALTQKAVMKGYRSYIQNGSYTNLNWIAMVNICNEVMRGAPVDSIDKDLEKLNVTINKNKAGIVAAVKLENLIKSLEGMTSNTLLQIPDFTRMDHMEYLIAFLIKMIMIATVAVVIIYVYRDGVSGELGLRTLWKSLSGIALTFAAICVIPAIFQLTYYASNKFLLQDEAIRILMYNQEKYESGVEIDMLEMSVPESTTDMSIQLDWISVPWYKQIENMLYGSTFQHLDEVKKEAYLQAPIADNYDVELYNDGVYTTCEQLFESIELGYTWYPSSDQSVSNAITLRAENDLQTASFYSPYYAFLYTLVANVNEYNQKFDTQNFTTKYQSGNRLKTVGLCNAYFTSKTFMEYDVDVMHLYEMYSLPAPEDYDHVTIWSPIELMQFEESGWYNPIADNSFDRRVELMNKYARDYIAEHRELLTKVTDETFLEVMALNMAIKYNQLFGIPAANALEIYNMDSNDLLRLSIATTSDAVMNSPMGYARYVYNLGGEPSVYAAAILTVIMWLGSFIKPLCTVITFISVFVSIWWFRVVLRKPSANLWGYLITCTLLCITNVLHSIILKVSTYLPDMGLPMLPCLLFIIFGQVVYLLLLSYVTGVALKDWSNLGYTKYEKTARRLQRKLGKDSTTDMLSGRIKHHENNWDYYDDLVEQHRSRNT